MIRLCAEAGGCIEQKFQLPISLSRSCSPYVFVLHCTPIDHTGAQRYKCLRSTLLNVRKKPGPTLTENPIRSRRRWMNENVLTLSQGLRLLCSLWLFANDPYRV